MAKYRTDRDLLDEIAELKRRIARLESNQQLPNSSIGQDSLAVAGGSLQVTGDSGPGGTEGFIITSGNFNTFLGQGTALQLYRDGLTDNSTPDTLGSLAFSIATLESGTSTFRLPTVEMFDKSGSTIISDAYNSRFGMSHPQLSTTWWDPSAFKTTTSGTYADIAQTFWNVYHPHLRIQVVSNNDAATTGQVQVIDLGNSNNVVGGPVTTPANAIQFNSIDIDRLDCIGSSGNGAAVWLAVQHRRASGAGTSRHFVAEMLGIDLS